MLVKNGEMFMQGCLAQMVALTCYGNAAIHGKQVPQFFPDNSTCQFCESVTFIAVGKSERGEVQATPFADSPDAWIQSLSRRAIVGLKLHQRAQNLPQISDRNSSGFVGGGRLWCIEGMRRDSSSEFWLTKWEVGNKNSPDRRIWRVTYRLCDVSRTLQSTLRDLDEIIADLRLALTEIRSFSETNDCSSFTPHFTNALRALDEPQTDIGYHKDLFPPGTLSEAAQSILKSAMSAWVFGGMGSWNDMGFEGETQLEYESVSDGLFNIVNEAIEAAATSSMNEKN
jgi:hypothetical protein